MPPAVTSQAEQAAAAHAQTLAEKLALAARQVIVTKIASNDGIPSVAQIVWCPTTALSCKGP